MMDDLKLAWKALSDPTRRRVLDLLRENPKTTGELCGYFSEISRYGVMKHIAVLQEAGLITALRQGREVRNFLNAVPIQQIYERWMVPFEAYWASSLLRIKQLSEAQMERADFMNQPTGPEFGSIRIEQEVEIDGTPERVFQALTDNVAAWWGAPYHMSASPSDLILEPKLGGRFVELWENGQGALWGTVTAIRHAELLEITGPVGMSGAVQGVAVFRLTAQGNCTRLHLTHSVVGQISDQAREQYALGWKDLLGTRLKAFVETGQRFGLGCAPPADISGQSECQT